MRELQEDPGGELQEDPARDLQGDPAGELQEEPAVELLRQVPCKIPVYNTSFFRYRVVHE